MQVVRRWTLWGTRQLCSRQGVLCNLPSRTRPGRRSRVSPRTRPKRSARRIAAETGDVEAMSVLGAMLLRRGDLDGAEPHLRAATAAGDRAAANNLGVLLHQRGYADDAAGWWRIAAVAGSAAAAHALGRHHRERGDEAGRGVLAAAVRRTGARAGRVRPRRSAGASRGCRGGAVDAVRGRAGASGGGVPAGPCA